VLEEMLQHTGGSGLSRGMASSARPKKKSDKKKEPSKLAKLRAKTEARGKFNNASMNKARKVKSSSPMGGKKNKVMCASLMAKRMKTMQELAEIKNQGLDVSEIKTRTVKCLTKLGKYISTILQDTKRYDVSAADLELGLWEEVKHHGDSPMEASKLQAVYKKIAGKQKTLSKEAKPASIEPGSTKRNGANHIVKTESVKEGARSHAGSIPKVARDAGSDHHAIKRKHQDNEMHVSAHGSQREGRRDELRDAKRPRMEDRGPEHHGDRQGHFHSTRPHHVDSHRPYEHGRGRSEGSPRDRPYDRHGGDRSREWGHRDYERERNLDNRDRERDWDRERGRGRDHHDRNDRGAWRTDDRGGERY